MELTTSEITQKQQNAIKEQPLSDDKKLSQVTNNQSFEYPNKAFKHVNSDLTDVAQFMGTMMFWQNCDLEFVRVINVLSPFSQLDFVGKTDSDVLPAKLAQKILPVKHSVLENNSDESAKIQLLCEGTLLFFEIIIRPITDPISGQIIGIFSTLTDISASVKKQCEIAGNEQRWFSSDIHKTLDRDLKSLVINFAELEFRFSSLSHKEAKTAEKVKMQIASSVDTVHSLLNNLTPIYERSNGLASAVLSLCKIVSESHNVSCKTNFNFTPDFMDAAISNQIFLIIEEAVNSITQFTDAKNITINTHKANGLKIEILDDGTTSSNDLIGSRGFSNTIIEKRAELLGLSISTVRNDQALNLTDISWDLSEFSQPH